MLHQDNILPFMESTSTGSIQRHRNTCTLWQFPLGTPASICYCSHTNFSMQYYWANCRDITKYHITQSYLHYCLSSVTVREKSCLISTSSGGQNGLCVTYCNVTHGFTGTKSVGLMALSEWTPKCKDPLDLDNCSHLSLSRHFCRSVPKVSTFFRH